MVRWADRVIVWCSDVPTDEGWYWLISASSDKPRPVYLWPIESGMRLRHLNLAHDDFMSHAVWETCKVEWTRCRWYPYLEKYCGLDETFARKDPA